MKRFLTSLCVLVLIFSMLGMTVAAEETAVAVIGGTNYTSLQEAVDAIEEGTTGLIELKKSTDETVTVTCDVYVDLAGNSIAGIDVTAGTFYGMDSATIIEAGDDANVSCGKIASVKGAVKPISVDDEYSIDSYLMAEDNGTSFHAVNLRLTDMSLRAEKAGVYFKSDFAGDSVVASKVKKFGVALSIKGVPTAANIKTDCVCSTFEGFKAGVNNNATSTLLSGIVKEENPFILNKRNAEMPVYGRAYAQLGDGTYIFGAAQKRSLRQQIEGFGRTWHLRSIEDKNSVYGMYETFASVMEAWNIPALVYHNYADLVDTAEIRAWFDAYSKLPIANASMTTEELRQLCVDFFRLQLTLPWTPNMDIVFHTDSDKLCSMKKGNVFSGMIYSNNKNTFTLEDGSTVEHIGAGAGNLYKMLKYYDPGTGILDVKAMGKVEDIVNIVTNQCHRGVSWGWARVSNNIVGTWGDVKPSNGMIPVGDYAFDDTAYTDTDINTEEIVGANTATTMYNAYAQLQPGDGLVSSKASHIEMCSVKAHVAYYFNNPRYGINPYSSYVYIIDQNAGWTIDAWAEKEAGQQRVQNNGIPIRSLGAADWEDKTITSPGQQVFFRDLYEDCYIPFTLPELAGTDPVEAGDAWLGTANKHEPNNLDITLTDLNNKVLYANYSISDIRYEVTDVEGNVLLESAPAVSTLHYRKYLALSKFLDTKELASYINGENVIRIYAHLSTGEWIEAFYTTLK